MNENAPPKTLVIIQPYVPQYRVQFFDELVQQLSSLGISCVVAADAPKKGAERRGDSAEAPWITRIRTRSFRFLGGTITLGGSHAAWKGADAVIVGHLGTSLDTYRALWDSIRGRRATAVWGHIDSYVNKRNPVDSLLEKWQLRHADHIFAYTSGGARYAVKNGASAADVTTVMNAVDTVSLVEASSHLTQLQILEFGVLHHLKRGSVVAFIGALDESKRIDFLVDALDEMWLTTPDIRVLVGGLGDQQGLLIRSVQRGQVSLLGYLDDKSKALVGNWASAILMPGRIGLVAVDALILRTPIITTDWPHHAPEAEYLTLGASRLNAPNSPVEYSRFVTNFLIQAPSDIGACDFPTLDEMVTNFRDGVIKLMGTPKNHRVEHRTKNDRRSAHTGAAQPTLPQAPDGESVCSFFITKPSS